MNVEQTQHSLFRQLDAAALVSAVAMAADQGQRQSALETQRLARQEALQVAAAGASDEALAVDQGPRKEGQRRGFQGRKEGEAPEEAKPKEPGLLGRNLDISA